MKKRIGINGFGRIGRNAARILLTQQDLELVAINSGALPESHAYLLKYDSVHGTLPSEVSYAQHAITIDSHDVQCFQEKSPESIPWKNLEVACVLECTGKFTTVEDASKHLHGSVRQVIVSSPAKDAMPTFVMGVNHTSWNHEPVISNSSCTTNCVSTVIKVLDDSFGVVRGSMTTVHAATDSQNLLDNSQKKGIRDRRSALVNLIPATSGSAKDVAKLFPHLQNRLPCRAIRVPTPTVSLIELIVEVKNKATADTINQAFRDAQHTSQKGILAVATEELVSTDYISDIHSSIIDPFLTDVVDGTLVHVTAWYDNEWGYAHRLVGMAAYCLNHS